MDRGCREISGVIRPPAEGAEVSDHGEDCRRRVTDVDVALPHDVYTGVQMLEIHPQNYHFYHFSGRSAPVPGGTAHSATRCSIMRSDMTRARPGHPRPSAYRCTKTAISISADCSLSQMAHHGTRPALVGVASRTRFDRLKSHVRASISR